MAAWRIGRRDAAAAQGQAARHVSFFALSLAVLIFLMLPQSIFRLGGAAVLALLSIPLATAGAGVGHAGRIGRRGQRRASGHGTSTPALRKIARRAPGDQLRPGWRPFWSCFPILSGLPLSQPAPWEDIGEISHLRMSLIENTGRWLGTTSTADYVPVTVELLPERQGSVVGSFAENLPLDRVNYESLPYRTTVETGDVRPLHTRYRVDSPKDFRFRLFQFDFPGWHV